MNFITTIFNLMHIFTYSPDPNNPHDKVSVTITTQAVQLEDLCDAFERYLKAAGFTFDGQVDIIKDDSH